MIRQKFLLDIAIKKTIELFLCDPYNGEYQDGGLLSLLITLDISQINNDKLKELKKSIQILIGKMKKAKTNMRMKVIYNYGPNEQIMGEIGFDKANKKILDIKSVNDSRMKNDFYFKRVAQKLVVISTKGENVFEDKIIIAS